MKKHAELGPSGWDRWSQCPGSVALSRGLPNTSSSYAAEGTVAHDIADRVLREQPIPAVGEMIQCEGFDILVDQEMIDSVNFYVDYVRQLAPTDGDVILPEQEVPIGHMTGEPDAVGTSDAIVIANGGKLMHVVDLKYGKGVLVSAIGNGQGRMYALGALHKLALVYDEIEEVEIHIVQPRIEDGISSETLSIGELEEFKDQVELAAGAVAVAVAGDVSTLVPGEKQCKFCPAGRAARCPALTQQTSNALALVSPASADDFSDLSLPKQAASVAPNEGVSNERLAEFLRAVPLIEAAIAGVRGEVERRLFAGETIPGFYLGEGRKGNRKWLDDESVDIEAELKKRLGAAAFEKKLISPATAEKVFKPKPKTWAKIKDLIVQSDGKPSVCKEGDKNPPYQISTAADFADISSAESETERLLG